MTIHQVRPRAALLIVMVAMIGCGRTDQKKSSLPPASNSPIQNGSQNQSSESVTNADQKPLEPSLAAVGANKTNLLVFVDKPRSLQLAVDAAFDQDDDGPMVTELWTGIGKRCLDTGDTASALKVLALLESKSPSLQILTAIAVIATERVIELTEKGQVNEAIEMADRIPPETSRQRSQSYCAIAIAREKQAPQQGLDPYLIKAIEEVDLEPNNQQRVENMLEIIRALVNADRIAQAEVLAATVETKLMSRRGWGPVAERLAINDQTDAAKPLLENKLRGLDADLYQFVERVMAKRGFQSRFEICHLALRQMKSPAFVARGSCLICDEMTDYHQQKAARALLGQTLETADKASLNSNDAALVLLNAISPAISLESKYMGQSMCESLRARFAPEFAAEGFLKLAILTQSDGAEAISRNLAIAEELARKIELPHKRVPILRRIYQSYSGFFDEELALQKAASLSLPVDRGHAYLGIAEGLPKDHASK